MTPPPLGLLYLGADGADAADGPFFSLWPAEAA